MDRNEVENAIIFLKEYDCYSYYQEHLKTVLDYIEELEKGGNTNED